MARRNPPAGPAARKRRGNSRQPVNNLRALQVAGNVPVAPTVWTEEQLAAEADKSLNAFVDRRLAEPHTRYAAHLVQRQRALARLFVRLRPIEPKAPDPDLVRDIVLDDELLSALRYAAGPPISEEDLGVLVTRNRKRVVSHACLCGVRLGYNPVQAASR